MTRTVIVSHSHPALKYGGGEVAAHRQYQHLRDLGQEAYFVGSAIGPEESLRYLGANQRVLSLGDGDFVIRSFGMDAFFMEQESGDLVTWLVDFLAAFNADVYHFHHVWNIGASTIRRLRQRLPQARLVITLHEFTAICANHGQMVKTKANQLCHEASDLACTTCLPQFGPLNHRLRRRRMTELLDQFDHLISPSQFLADRFVAWGVAGDRILVLENGVPFATRSGEVLRDLDALSTRFAYFGQATPTKGLNILIEAAGLIERQRLVRRDALAKDRVADAPDEVAYSIEIYGIEEAEFTKLWPDLEVPQTVRFIGRYRPEDVVGLMQDYGWIIMPSIWWENSPVVIEEAKAAGVPMIVSNIGGMKEKTTGWGRQFKVGSPDDLAAHLLKVAGNADVLKAAMDLVPQPFQMDAFYAAWRHMLDSAV